jgi:hypothetical protein
MRWYWWLLIVLVVIILPLTAILLITRVFITPHKSWWWFFGALIFYFILSLIGGVIFLIFRLGKNKEPKIEIAPSDARAKAVLELKMDEDNPDNFMIEEQRIKRVGQSGYNRTPILWLHGKGSEKNQVIDALINLDNIKGETTWLRNKTEKQIIEAMSGMAENPESEIKEERSIGIDEFGRPMTKITTTKQSIAEIKLKEEKAEAENANVL